MLSLRGLKSGLLSLRVSDYRLGLGIPSATPNLLSLRGGFTVGHTHFAIPLSWKYIIENKFRLVISSIIMLTFANMATKT